MDNPTFMSALSACVCVDYGLVCGCMRVFRRGVWVARDEPMAAALILRAVVLSVFTEDQNAHSIWPRRQFMSSGFFRFVEFQKSTSHEVALFAGKS